MPPAVEESTFPKLQFVSPGSLLVEGFVVDQVRGNQTRPLAATSLQRGPILADGYDP
jgi:hypothetical protein